MKSPFQYELTFPLIADVIFALALGKDRFVVHDEIVAAVLSDPDGQALTAEARVGANWKTDSQAAASMVAWFSQRITVGKSQWGQLFDRERIGGAWAYRPRKEEPLATDPEIEISRIEGELRLYTHRRKERDRALRTKKIEARLAAGLEPCCEACGITTNGAFPGLNGEILEVHHRLPLSASSGPVATALSDLALLCPNCHRAIHKTRPLFNVENFRESFASRSSTGAD